ncbi:hypothetical protein L873DRAFT_1874855 [Choiromyces venosus 120613-1]|uniref:Uncharacterized protein n=1 Tax=Choiromyces venosus 120613-1 TaxID=1336337 RepID=A0A3N4J331_9PEZI|nr:hypothetical protein L873DRAFT_1874855 [Choiromyces venosus 120613-1]
MGMINYHASVLKYIQQSMTILVLSSGALLVIQTTLQYHLMSSICWKQRAWNNSKINFL